MGRFIDLTGQRFTRLTVVAFAGKTRHFKLLWLCKCDCGKESTIVGASLTKGNTKSCGCLCSDISKARSTTHGASYVAGYNSWANMLQRCYNHKRNDYHNYGGRGIRVCEFLRASPTNLISIIGEKPSLHSLDRKDNNSHYSCGVCSECLRLELPMNIKWSTGKQQARNKRTNRLLTINGVTQCVSEWAEQTGIIPNTLVHRYNLGYDPLKPSLGAKK